MLRRVLVIIGVATVIIGGLWLLNDDGHITSLVKQYVENSDIATFRPRYTPDQLLDMHRREFSVDPQHTVKEPQLKYLPYLLMEVKFAAPDRRTREGVVIWSLIDGEMVLNTDTWEHTHGFEDTINTGADRFDFKLMHALMKYRGTASLEQLQQELHMDKDALHYVVEGSIAKHLVVQKGNEIQLHFQDPKLAMLPESKMTESLVKKPYEHSQRISGKYTGSQIQKTARAAFGDDFTVRSIREVYLPVYSVEILNPDGSTWTTYWNALTGQKINFGLKFGL